jgi:hypothetical protein
MQQTPDTAPREIRASNWARFVKFFVLATLFSSLPMGLGAIIIDNWILFHMVPVIGIISGANVTYWQSKDEWRTTQLALDTDEQVIASGLAFYPTW